MKTLLQLFREGALNGTMYSREAIADRRTKMKPTTRKVTLRVERIQESGKFRVGYQLDGQEKNGVLMTLWNYPDMFDAVSEGMVKYCIAAIQDIATAYGDDLNTDAIQWHAVPFEQREAIFKEREEQ